MRHLPDEELTPFVFSDPGGKRWPRLRLFLIVAAVLFFLGTVLFVQTLFVAPQMNVPLSLRQLKGQLKALQRQNPGRTTLGCFTPLAEIQRRPAGSKKTGAECAGSSGPTPEKAAEQRDQAGFLRQWRSLQLFLTRAACLPDHPSLP